MAIERIAIRKLHPVCGCIPSWQRGKCPFLCFVQLSRPKGQAGGEYNTFNMASNFLGILGGIGVAFGVDDLIPIPYKLPTTTKIGYEYLEPQTTS